MPNKKNTLLILLLIPAMLVTAYAKSPDPLPPQDRQLINTLLDRLKDQKDIKFIRLDKTYDAKTAAWYLRYKWDHNKDKVHSVEDFITLSATGGDHNEITYYVQYPDGKRIPARQALESSLKKIREESKP